MQPSYMLYHLVRRTTSLYLDISNDALATLRRAQQLGPSTAVLVALVADFRFQHLHPPFATLPQSMTANVNCPVSTY